MLSRDRVLNSLIYINQSQGLPTGVNQVEYEDHRRAFTYLRCTRNLFSFVASLPGSFATSGAEPFYLTAPDYLSYCTRDIHTTRFYNSEHKFRDVTPIISRYRALRIDCTTGSEAMNAAAPIKRYANRLCDSAFVVC